MEYYLTTFSDGQTVLTAVHPGMSIGLDPEDGVTEVKRQLLKDYSPEAFGNLKELAATNSIGYDDETGEITLTPKAS